MQKHVIPLILTSSVKVKGMVNGVEMFFILNLVIESF